MLARVSIPIGFSNPLQRRGSRSEGGTPSLVSIPIGFSNPLQPSLDRAGCTLAARVSIPIGFSNPLQPGIGAEGSASIRFQSLLGFLIRCNTLLQVYLALLLTVSIPIGFSNPLQRPERWGGGSDGCFNPYWVF